MIIDCIADLHGHYPSLEGGDLLIVAGDLTAKGAGDEYIEFFQWCHEQDYRKVIVIAGNHDNYLQEAYVVREPAEKIIYLQDRGCSFEGLKIWGSPWTLKFPGMNPKCMAFTKETEEELAEKWALIPDDTDILVTHGPPYRILDKTIYGEDCGSDPLMCKIQKMKLNLHVFGHIHEAYGKRDDIHELWCKHPTVFVNASHVNEFYYPENPPIRVELEGWEQPT